jgi:hypothetical protein
MFNIKTKLSTEQNEDTLVLIDFASVFNSLSEIQISKVRQKSGKKIGTQTPQIPNPWVLHQNDPNTQIPNPNPDNPRRNTTHMTSPKQNMMFFRCFLLPDTSNNNKNNR